MESAPKHKSDQIVTRGEHVGSLLRPAELKQARGRYEAGKLDLAELREIENRAIDRAVAIQRQIGLASVTDGEMRRLYWHFDFLDGLQGVKMVREQGEIPGTAARTAAFVHRHRLAIVGPIRWQPHRFIDDFRYLATRAGESPARQTIPSPSFLHFRFSAQAVAAGIYRDPDELASDLAEAYAGAVRDFAAAGCRYLQFDDTTFAMLCDGQQVEQAIAAGIYHPGLPRQYADVINRAIAARPADMRIAIHLCRGNFQSTWVASGGYEPVAEVLFNSLNADVYFLEYDSDRAGGFEPLRFLPRGRKIVVLGLITSKDGNLESKDTLKRRIDEAARHAPIEQLALSPQCGFASTEEGNTLSEDQQWAKLRLCVEVAREVWPA
jgi:5-methyltetrahydropteroyltriglutamate--homocysteine methyltransferase